MSKILYSVLFFSCVLLYHLFNPSDIAMNFCSQFSRLTLTSEFSSYLFPLLYISRDLSSIGEICLRHARRVRNYNIFAHCSRVRHRAAFKRDCLPETYRLYIVGSYACPSDFRLPPFPFFRATLRHRCSFRSKLSSLHSCMRLLCACRLVRIPLPHQLLLS